MMNYFNNEDQPDEAYTYETEEASQPSRGPVGMYLAFIAFAFQSTWKMLLTGLAYSWRHPIVASVMFLVVGGVFALGINQLQLKSDYSDMPDPVESASGPLADAVGGTQKIANSATASREEPAADQEEKRFSFMEDDAPGMNPMTSVTFFVEGELLAGAPLTFTVPKPVMGRSYTLDLGNGTRMPISSSLTYTYPEEGNFRVVVIEQDGDVVQRASQLLQIGSLILTEEEAEESEEAELLATAEAPAPTAGTVEIKTINQPVAPQKLDSSVAEKPGVQTSRSPDTTPVIVSNVPSAWTVPTKPLAFSEVPPVFPGGEQRMVRFLNEQIRYPKLAKENEIGGKVYTQFIVQPNGTITDAKVVRGIGYGCDEEALRIVRMMPNWTPGRERGQSVPVIYTLPVNFDFSQY